MVKKLVSIHKNDVPTLTYIKLFYKPSPCSSGDIIGRNQKHMVQ